MSILIDVLNLRLISNMASQVIQRELHILNIGKNIFPTMVYMKRGKYLERLPCCTPEEQAVRGVSCFHFHLCNHTLQRFLLRSLLKKKGELNWQTTTKWAVITLLRSLQSDIHLIVAKTFFLFFFFFCIGWIYLRTLTLSQMDHDLSGWKLKFMDFKSPNVAKSRQQLGPAIMKIF